MFPFLDQNSGSNSATVVAGNGAFNGIGGSVSATADQHVGDHSYGGWDFGGANTGANSATVLAGNGVGNLILGDVSATADQHIGDSGFHMPVLF
jgi:hypothetical protein